MAKKPTKPKEEKKKLQTGTTGLKTRLKPVVVTETFTANGTERVAMKYITRRATEMQQFRRGLAIEEKWKEADEEYIPHELDFGTTRKRFETDQDTGLRSRMVPVGDTTQQWRQASSAPTLLAKIQIALGLIVDKMPEADLVPLVKKYEATTDLAYALWKRNWSITNAREKLKLIIFDLMKYGWAAQRTFPHKVSYDKRVLVEKDLENPENDKYEEKEITWFNDVDREPLSVYKTWIDEMARPYDPFSVNESYFEKDYSYDEAEVEFGEYPNWKYVKENAVLVRMNESRKGNRSQQNEQMKQRQDIVTIGFFESRWKDLYAITVPQMNIPLCLAPLPNDDGYLSITNTLWILRKSNLPYGVSLWEIIRQNKGLFDKMKNMTMDQLVLSIMKFGFFSGTNTALGDGKMEIVPGQARQLTSSTGKPEVNWMEIPGPGAESWKGIAAVDAMMDNESGIGPTLEGEMTAPGKTLGEHKLALEAQLKRLKVPLENIAYLVDQDAYLTLSWMSQLYSVPVIMEFADEEKLKAYNEENAMTHVQLFGEQQEDGSVTGPYQAHYLPELSLHLEDKDGQLKRGKESKFYQVGKDIKPQDMKWRGVFKTRPRSLIDTSEEIAKASKMEMFNVLVPLLQLPPEIAAKPAEQICKINEEDPQDWLPDAFMDYLKNGPAPKPAGPIKPAGEAPDGKLAPATGAIPPEMPPMAPEGAPAPIGGPNQTLQNATGMTPQTAPKVVPSPNSGSFNRRL